METAKNKYRIESNRLASWDYGSPGLYFVTICTQQRKSYFGKISDGVMVLNEIGSVVKSEWEKTIDLRPDMNLELGEFVVMPNHFHAIIIIGENDFNRRRDALPRVFEKTDLSIKERPKEKRDEPLEDAQQRVSTSPVNRFAAQSKNLASIIRGFKGAVSTYATKKGFQFGWQERFHDHIIDSYDEYLRISKYIYDNPANWNSDRFFTNE